MSRSFESHLYPDKKKNLEDDSSLEGLEGKKIEKKMVKKTIPNNP